MTTFEDRQRQASHERRSSWAPAWATSGEIALYRAEQAHAEALRLERARQSVADMADLIEHAKQGEFREID